MCTSAADQSSRRKEKKKKERNSAAAVRASRASPYSLLLLSAGRPRGGGLFICSFWRKRTLLAEATLGWWCCDNRKDGCDVTAGSGMKAVASRRSAVYATRRWISWYFFETRIRPWFSESTLPSLFTKALTVQSPEDLPPLKPGIYTRDGRRVGPL